MYNAAISTHTPLAGRDSDHGPAGCIISISTHTPLAGRDTTVMYALHPALVFLLTRPLRDVTEKVMPAVTNAMISTHTPLAGRDKDWDWTTAFTAISTHTPLAGRDEIKPTGRKDPKDFYSHAPCGT